MNTGDKIMDQAVSELISEEEIITVRRRPYVEAMKKCETPLMLNHPEKAPAAILYSLK